MLHESDVIEQFRAAMRERDIHVTSDIIADGKLHRAHVDGDKKGQRNAWYILHCDEKPAGAFGCNRRYGNDQKFTWTGKASKPLTAAERREIRARIEKQKLEREAAERARHAAAAALARQLWDSADECTQHPYLTRKQIRSHGLRVGKWEKIDEETGDVRLITKQALLIPIRDTKKQIHSLQAIFPRKLLGDRDKDYLTGGNKAGHFYSIGKPVEFEGRIVIIICEGYATGASLHEATGHAVIVAFDAPNLLPVAQSIRTRFPDAIIIMAADNDQWTLKPVNNPGVTRAREAALAIGGLVAVPPFEHADGKPDEEGKWSGPNDFNDLHLLRGADAVRAIINGTLAPEPVEEVVDDIPPWEGHDDEMTVPSAPMSDDGDDDDDAADAMAREGGFTILGYDHGEYYLFLHEKKQIMAYSRRDFSASGLIEIADQNYWETNFAGKNGVNANAAANFIIRVAHRRGIYDPNCVRACGAWLDEGRFVFHHGAYLSVDGVRTDVTKISSRYVYELSKTLPSPAETPLTDGEGERILNVAKMFRWSRAGSAALLAGWVFLAPICGALRWRPHIWLTGPAGNGKSTILEKFVFPLIGQGACIYGQGNSTEAGVRQRVGSHALPVLLDEAEKNNDKETARVEALLSLIRQSSTESAAETLKGTVNGDGMSFHVRSMFCLASILVGLDKKADIDRLSILSLRPSRGVPGALDHWNETSKEIYDLTRDTDMRARLLRRAINMLPTVRANIEVFVAAAARRFGSQRDGDQYGTLLAGAWSLTSSMPATAFDAEALIAQFDWDEHVEQSDTDDSQLALHALMGAAIREGGTQISVHELIRRALGESVDGVSLNPETAAAVLRRNGVLVREDRLILPNQSGALRALLEGTPYAADPKSVFGRLPGATNNGGNQVKFNGLKTRVISLPLSLVGFGDEAQAGETEEF